MNFSNDNTWLHPCWRIELLNIIKNLDIQGVTGRIRFHNGDRIGEIVIEQILGRIIEYISFIYDIFIIDFSIS